MLKMKGKGACVIPRWKNMLVDIQSKGSMKLFPHAMPCNQISNTMAYKNEGVVTSEGLQESSKGNSL
jgi:hypothetical protein